MLMRESGGYYQRALDEGEKLHAIYPDIRAEYWAVRHSARTVAVAFLNFLEAQEGKTITPAMLEAARQIACEVAED